MTTVDPGINDHMTKKLQEERARASRDGTRMSSSNQSVQDLTDQTVKLHQAMLRRQELMEKIKEEQRIQNDLRRPRSYTGRHDRLSPPPSRRAGSQPVDFRPGDTPRHIIEHQFRPIRLDPLDNPPRPPAPIPLSAPPPPQPSQPPAPIFHTTTVPQPYIVNTGTNPLEMMKPTNTKAEMYEMMMMQNAQMHSMIMQQLMISALPKQPTTVDVNKRVALDLDDVVSMMELMMMQNAQMHQMIMQQLMLSAVPKQTPSPTKVAIEIDDNASLKSEKKSSTVHHHHYTTPPASLPPPPPPPMAAPVSVPASFPYTLPPVQIPPVMPSYYMSPRYYPHEMEPLKVPRVRRKKSPKRVKPPEKKRVYPPLPFPGPWALRKFRHAAYAVFFSIALRKSIKGKPRKAQNLSEEFIFAIKLKEIVAALHFIYLNPEKKVHGILQQVIADNARDLTAPITSSASSSDKDKALEDLAVIIENVVYEMTEIMPSTGVLGTHKKAHVYDLIQNGKLFPRGYLWQMEKELLHFDGNGRTVNVGEYEAFVLLAGMFIGRAIVTTLLLKPVEYGMTSSQLTYRAERNLKMVASLFIYLLRRAYGTDRKSLPQLPFEIGRFLFQDNEMNPAFKRLKNSFEYAEGLLLDWAKEYIKRLRNVPR